MRHLEHSSTARVHRDLEDAWRVRTEIARERYQTASKRYRELLKENSGGLISQHDDTLALARRAESEALEEFRRTLKLFTELLVHGRIPEEELAAKASGCRD